MTESEEIFWRIREWFRKNPQTNWGKNQIIKLLDEMEEKFKESKNEMERNS